VPAVDRQGRHLEHGDDVVADGGSHLVDDVQRCKAR
jgi:hypothetical protein